MDLPDKQLLDAAPDAMVVVDESGRIVLVNQQTESLFGYSRSELVGQPVDTLIPERHRTIHSQHLRGYFKHSKIRPMGEGRTLFGRSKDGIEFPVEISLSPVESSSGKFVAGAIRDVTRHKNTEQSLFGILETSLNEIYIFDASSLRFLEVNEGARRNLGYNLEELRRLSPVDIKPELTTDQFQDLLEPLRSGTQEFVDFETVHRRKDGSLYPVEVHVQKNTFGSGPVYCAIILDITDRKRAETVLRESNEQLTQRVAERTSALANTIDELRSEKLFSEKLVSTLRGIVLLLDVDGRIIHWNPYLEELTGYTASEVLNHDWFDTCIPECDRESIRAQFHKVMEVGFDDGYTNAILVKGGEQRLIEWHSRTLRGRDKETIWTLCTGYDVTDRVAAAAELEEARDAAERATSTKTRFLAAASHDLRQPLQSVGLYLSVLMREAERITPDKLKDVGTRMQQSLDTMGQLLDALLDISKLDSGAVTPELSDFGLQGFVRRIANNNSKQAEANGLVLSCSCDDWTVHSDPGLLERVIDNFVSNAIRYTSHGEVTISCKQDAERVRISVSDTGEGIAAENIENIFEEYYQLGNQMRDRRKGLGLGLSIVRHIGRILNHPIEVESEPGVGSTFSVEVPLGTGDVAKQGPAVSRKDTTRDSAERVVLLVDDDPAIADATNMLLSVSGFRVHTAMDGDEALAHIAAGVRPDIVVSDFRLPGDNGVEVVRSIRNLTIKNLPSVLITGDTSAKEIKSANLVNCSVLHKPVDTDELISLIEKATC